MPSKGHEYSTKTRLIRVLRSIQDQPYRYTKKELAALYDVDKDTIKSDFEAIRNAGFELDYDPKYRYAFAADKPFEDLKALLQLNEQEQLLLLSALQQLSQPSDKLQQLQSKSPSNYRSV